MRSSLAPPPVTAALLRETGTIPIVFVNVADPIGAGFVTSMARPGGNATGFTNVEASLGGKWVQVLKELNPNIARLAVMFNPKTAPAGGAFYFRLVEDAARSIGVATIPNPVENAAEIERIIEAFAREPNGAFVVQPDITYPQPPQTDLLVDGPTSAAHDISLSQFRRRRAQARSLRTIRQCPARMTC